MKTPFCVFLLLASACSGLLAPAASAQISYGDATAVGDGWIRSYVTSNAGQPQRVGFQFNQAALTTFGSWLDTTLMLDLPSGAPAPFNHLMLNWNSAGHPGPGYGVPHFDFHFYFSTPEEVAAIPFSLAPAPIPSRFVASGYIPDAIVVPQMGWHWLDSLAPEFSNPADFTQTFIYGYYGGKMTYVEPMITKAFLDAGGDHVLAVRQPMDVQTSGYYPTEYGINVADGIYDVFVGGLDFRASAVPEPATWGLWGAALLAGLIGWRRVHRTGARSVGAA
jgi:hypothetical protein